VHPTLVAQSELVAHVNGVLNVVQVESDAAGKTLFSGPGAGGAATASAVVADIIATALHPEQTGGGSGSSRSIPIQPIEKISSAYYLRIPTRDEPGVFAEVTQILSSHNINLDAVIQKDSHGEGGAVDIVILTEDIQEAQMNEALAQLEALATVTAPVMRIRVAPQD
jgi:homoserine dehydrogenase